MEKRKNQLLPMLLVGLKLLLICAIVAGVVSFVYTLTAEQYEINVRETQNREISKIFGLSGLTCEPLPVEDGEDGMLYLVKNGEVTVGYCAEIKSAGFGGDIEMMVGYDVLGNILGVGIVSLSETPGLGAKVSENAFLSQFIGQGSDITLGEDVDAISGATISSRAVTDGVNRATELLQNCLAEGGADE